MKLKAFSFALLLAGIAASFALAGPPPKKGSETASTSSTAPAAPSCGPTVSYILNGKFSAAGADSFTMEVTRSNKHGVKAGKNATIYVDAKSTLRRDGKAAKLADFKAGDRLNVQARACRKADSASLKLVAKRVVGHSAKAAESDSDSESAPAPAPAP